MSWKPHCCLARDCTDWTHLGVLVLLGLVEEERAVGGGPLVHLHAAVVRLHDQHLQLAQSGGELGTELRPDKTRTFSVIKDFVL